MKAYAIATLTYKDDKGGNFQTFIRDALISIVDTDSIVKSMMNRTFDIQAYSSPVPFMAALAHLIATTKVTVSGTAGPLTQHVAERMTSANVLQQLARLLAGAKLQDGTTFITSLSRSIIPNLGLSNTTVSQQILQGMDINNMPPMFTIKGRASRTRTNLLVCVRNCLSQHMSIQYPGRCLLIICEGDFFGYRDHQQ